MQLLESPIPPLTADALWIIICKRPAPHFDNHLKGMKCELKCVFCVKESNFTGKKDQKFHICLRSGPRWLTPAPPPLTVSWYQW